MPMFNGLTQASQDARYAPESGSPEYASSMSQYWHRMNPQTLDTWVAKRELVRAGTGDARVLCVGDSTVAGIVTDNTQTWPYKLATLLDGDTLLSAQPSLAVPNALTDPRFTLGSGWPNTYNYGWGIKGWVVNSPAGNLVYANPDVTADTFVIYHLSTTGSGTLYVSVDGGAETPYSLAAATAMRKIVIDLGPPSTAHTIALRVVGFFQFCGIESYDSTQNYIQVANAGVGSSSASTWNAANSTLFGGRAAITAYAPDLTLIALGINDGINNNTPETFYANYAPIITTAQATGDVVLISPIPSDTDPEKTREAQYREVQRMFPSCGFIDLYGYARGDWDYWNDLGLMRDQRHPNDAGYQHIAEFIHAALSSV